MTLKDMVARQAQTVSEGKTGGGDNDRRTSSWSDRFSWPGRIMLLLAIVLSPWAFGSVEHWAQRWITVCLLVGLIFWWFETAMNKRSSQVFPFLFFPVTAGLCIGLFQTVELSGSPANWLLGRQVEIYAGYTGEAGPAGATEHPATISLDTPGTWHQIRILVMALAGLMLGCRYFRTKRDVVLLLTTIALNGLAIGCFGIVQKFTADGFIYWYRDPSLGGMPFGPFVNRNNASGYLLICLAGCLGLLPIIMSSRKQKGPVNLVSREMPFWRRYHFVAMEFFSELTATKLAVIFMTGMVTASVAASLSRGGLLALLLAGGTTILAYGMARQPKNSGFVIFPILIVLALLGGYWFFGAELEQRFEKVNLANLSETEVRFKHWRDTWDAVGELGPLGSGLGSYRGIHRLYRSDPESEIFDFAENQYFQALIEAGWPGLILFLIAWLLAFKCATLILSKGQSPTSVGIGVMGIFLIFSQATVSLFDFGFYIPSNMLVLSVLFGFLSYHSQSLGERLTRKSWLRFQVPNYVIQVVVLVLFAANCLVALDLHKRASMDQLMTTRINRIDRQSFPTIDATEECLQQLMPQVVKLPSPKALNYSASLMIHRCRLQFYETLSQETRFAQDLETLEDDELQQMENNIWELTALPQIQENLFALSRMSQIQESEFHRLEAIQANLPTAERLLQLSRDASPLQPVVHLRLAQVAGVLHPYDESNAESLEAASPQAAEESSAGREDTSEAPKFYPDLPGSRDMENAITLAPANVGFQLNAALFYLQSIHPDPDLFAERHLRAALLLDPSQFELVMNLLSGKTNRSITAISPIEIKRNILFDQPDMLFKMARDYLNAKERSADRSEVLEAAAEILEDRLERDDLKNHKNFELLGDIRWLQGQLDLASANLRQASVYTSDNRDILYKLIKVHLESDELDEASELVKKRFKKRPDERWEYNLLRQEVEQRLKDRRKDELIEK